MKTIAANQKLKALDTAQLKEELAKSLEMTAKHINYLGQIWKELESRGEDMSDMRFGLAAYLPLIANNKMDANILIKYAGQKTLLGALSNLPIDEQRKIADSGYVTLVKLDENGTRSEIQTPLTKLAAADIYQVFSDTGVRTTDDQFRLVDRRFSKPNLAKPKRAKARRVKVDAKDRVLLVSNTAADLDRVIEALSDYYGLDLTEIIARKSKR